jgi:hypothetical protein
MATRKRTAVMRLRLITASSSGGEMHRNPEPALNADITNNSRVSKIVVNRVGDGLERVDIASDPWKQQAESIEGRLKN